MKKENRWRIIWVIVFMLFLADMIIHLVRGPKRTKPNSSISSPDPSRKAREYDFYKDRWVYEDEMPKGSGITIQEDESYQSLDEEDIQEYLENHLDGYKEDTYWGEEWDGPDKY